MRRFRVDSITTSLIKLVAFGLKYSGENRQSLGCSENYYNSTRRA
jgi:hypothetical protein